jgi:hypothetical protein
MPASTALIREYVQLTQESAFGVPVTTPVRGTSQIVVRLPGPNQQTMRPNPVVQPVPYGGGFSVIRDSVSDKTELKGTLTTPLFYSQAAFLMGWGLQRIATGTTPWTTTEPNSQFASCTLHHCLMDDLGNWRRTRYRGVKADQFKLNISEDSQFATVALDVLGGTYDGNVYDPSTDPDDTEAPIPDDDEFPSDFVLFIESNGGFTLGAGLRAEYTSLALAAAHAHDIRYYANRFVQVMRSFGSQISIDADLTFLTSPDDRAAFQEITPLAGKVIFTNGVKTITLDLMSNNRIKQLDDDTQLGKLYGRKFSLENRYDGTAGNWFTATVA